MEGNGEHAPGPKDPHDELKRLRSGRREYDFDPKSGELSRRDDVFTEGEALPSQVESHGQLRIDHERAIRKLERQLDSPEGLLSVFTVDHVRRHLTPLLVELREHVRKQQPLAKDSSLHEPLDAWTEKLSQAMGRLTEALGRRQGRSLDHLTYGLPLAALLDEVVLLRNQLETVSRGSTVENDARPNPSEHLKLILHPLWQYLTQPIGSPRLPTPRSALEYATAVAQASRTSGRLPGDLLRTVVHHSELDRFAGRVEAFPPPVHRAATAEAQFVALEALERNALDNPVTVEDFERTARRLGLEVLRTEDLAALRDQSAEWAAWTNEHTVIASVADWPTATGSPVLVSHGQSKSERALHLFRVPERESTEWLDTMVQKEQAALTTFFGREVDLAQFRETLKRYGKEKIEEWAKLGLEPHFLPARTLTKDTELPGWKERPNAWYWEQLGSGQLLLPNQQGNLEVVREARLPGKTLLVDTRCKPEYDRGVQLWAADEDFCGSIVAQLRKQGTLKRRLGIPDSSRFGVTAAEWEEHVRPAVAKRLGLRINQMVSETALEANVIPQLFRGMARAKDGTTTTWVWYEERFKGAAYRLSGGSSDYGGLAYVYGSHASDWSGGLAFRPLGVLD